MMKSLLSLSSDEKTNKKRRRRLHTWKEELEFWEYTHRYTMNAIQKELEKEKEKGNKSLSCVEKDPIEEEDSDQDNNDHKINDKHTKDCHYIRVPLLVIKKNNK